MEFLKGVLIIVLFAQLILLWCFAMFDIFRRDDLGGWAQGLWVVAVLVFPFFGPLAYIIVRPKGLKSDRVHSPDWSPADSGALAAAPARQTHSPAVTDPVGQLAALAELRDKGALTEAEFQQEKERVLAAAAATQSAAGALPTVSMPSVVLPPAELQTAAPSNSSTT